MELVLSPKMIKFVELVYEKKQVTRDDVNLPMLSFYALSKYLKNNDIIKVNGLDDKNRHILALTPKGKKFAELVVQMKKVLDGGMDNE